jgi:signal transduction histidine kinase
MVDDINNRAHAAEPESNGELERLREELKAKSEALRTAQSALTRVEGDLKNLLNEGELAVLMVDGGLSIRRSSPAAQRILGLPADSALPLSEIAASRGFHDLSERVEQVLESLTSQVYETTDARGRWYRVSIRPYKFTQNTVDGAVVYLLDIDALKRLVDDAQSAREEAEHGNRARDDILAVLSHELRTPLASILLQSQMLMQGQVPADKLEKTYAVIERGAKLQSQLIDDLLDASRIVSGRLKLEVQAFELCPVVQEAVASLQPAAATRGVTLEATVDESIGQVWSDPTRVRQVVIKLVANAIKFTPSGGRVSVELTLSDGAAALRVSDSGAGIGAEFLPHVFDRLTQQQSTITRRHGGLGLGLAIVHHVIESLGGRVTANSSGLGHGAT